MNRYMIALGLIALMGIGLVGCGCDNKEEEVMMLQKLAISTEASLYPEAGFIKGVSGAFGGNLGEWTIYGGGCNFPDKGPSEGGTKKFYKSVYGLRGDETIRLGELVAPIAYGASIPSSDGKQLYFIGGTDGAKAFDTIHEVTERGVRLLDVKLPTGWFEGSGAYFGDSLFLAGGWVADGVPMDSLVQVNLKTGEHKTIAVLPDGARIQCVSFVLDGCFYIFGGYRPAVGLEQPPYMHDKAYRIDLNAEVPEWELIAERPTLENGRQLLFVGSTVAVGPQTKQVYAVGGVDWEVFEPAVMRGFYKSIATRDGNQELLNQYTEEGKAYMSMPEEDYHFMPHIIRFVPTTNGWEIVATDKAFATAGAVLTISPEAATVIGGERKPGVRTFDGWRQKL
ncbi:MAG: hypothetical protein PUK66_06115 [Bacteroidales bacterium]|uniref:hypothetical protein n=1 Tax=Porphyromonas sp. TaxID=1924944 RepID=UPI002970708E|nr:hypothetical protein [Porphyromonas sp.]MDD7438387.1 hypothetical protein [Bacteroidales bacterium]MDY3068013.1 hypothetical protein [Porphyromonas sp.]